jgi:hypothetical protein
MELTGDETARAIAALLFMNSIVVTYDMYSTLNSSPWTAESFGGDPEKAKSCLNYVHHGVANSMVYAGVSTIISGNWWPVVGAASANAYLYWLYTRALDKAKKSGSTGWGTGVLPAKRLQWSV